MHSSIWLVTVLAAAAMSGDTLAQSAGPFDGKWTTVVTCPAADGAGSFTLLVDAEVKGVKRRWIGPPYRHPKGTPLIDGPGR